MSTTTNSALKMTPLDAQGDWDWVEIHWSKKDSWELDKYSCPILDQIEGSLPGVDAIPKKYMKKNIEDLYDEFSKDKEPDINLHKALVDASQCFEKNNGMICTAVRQWVIIEIAYDPNKTSMLYPRYPELDLWAFLQPQNIGNKDSMKMNLGYVIDDFPRGGWFRVVIRHVEEDSNGVYNPHLVLLHEKSKQYTSLGKVEWKKTTTSTKTSRLHKRPTQERYLLKVETIVRNLDTKEDSMRRIETALNFIARKKIEPMQIILKREGDILPPKDNYSQSDTGADDAKKMTSTEIEKFFRFETGSYLKVWVRNAHMPWKNVPTRFDDDDFMMNMHLLDSPAIVTSTGMRVDMTFVLNYLKEKGSEGNAGLPQDWFYESPEGFFRPYSYKNHAWKRNRFSMDPDGKYEKDKWYYVGLWPAEVVHAVENLDGSLFGNPGVAGLEPSKANVGLLFGVSLAYLALMGIGYKVISGLKEQVEKKEEANKEESEDKKDGDGKKTEGKKSKPGAILQKLLGAEDLPKIAAMIASYGFPDKNEKNWLGAGDGNEKTYDNMKKRYAADANSFGSVAFFTKFYKLIQVLTIGALDMLDGEETAALINTVMSSDPATDSEFRAFDYKLSLLEQKAEFEILKGHKIKRLGGSLLPPPYLMWLAYTISLKLTYGLKGSIEFTSLSELKVGIAADETSAGAFFDLGAVWTMSKELGEAFTGKVNRITDKDSTEFDKKKDPHPFADTLEEIFSYVDIQIGCGIKFTLTGSLAGQMDLSPGAKDKDGKNKTRLKPPDDEKPSFALSVSMPIYGKLSVLSKEYKAISCDLLFITPSAAALIPTGVYLGDVQIIGAADGARWKFGNVALDKSLILPDGKREFCIGEKIISSGSTISIVSQKEMKTDCELPYFQTYFKEPNDEKIELETKSYYAGKSIKMEYQSDCKFESVFSISQNKLLSKSDYANMVSKLLKGGYSSELNCCYSGDILQVARFLENIKIKAPRISKFEIKDKKELYTIVDVVVVEFCVENLMQKDLPLYLKVYEENTAVAGGNKEIEIDKNKTRKEVYFTCKQVAGSTGTYSCSISLGELEKVERFIMEWGNWDLCFKVSLDFEGNFPILFKNGNEYSEMIQFERKR